MTIELTWLLSYTQNTVIKLTLLLSYTQNTALMATSDRQSVFKALEAYQI